MIHARIGDSLEDKERRIQNLTLLVMKLARRLTVTDAGPHAELNHAIAKQATEYLKANGLTSPLRDFG